MSTIYTVKPDQLTRYAAQIERDAEQSLQAWIVLGQAEKYSAAMQAARSLRSAAAERNIGARREILRNSGFTVKTPRAA
jgi:hypothetical protein